MPRDERAYLSDILDSCNAILGTVFVWEWKFPE
jgi:hypothetical protein